MVLVARRSALRRTPGLAKFAVVFAILLTLLFTFRLWSFSYFWTDDFNNIALIRSQSALQMASHLADPFAGTFRPVGLLAYWALFHAFGLNPLPYHLAGWTLHALNTFLIFLVLRRLLRSSFAAVAGTAPFVLRVNFADIYWSFGTIFELLACAFMLAGLHGWIKFRKSVPVLVALTGVYVLAIKSKEMAISLVAVWFLYECCAASDLRGMLRRVLPWFVAPVLVMALFGYAKVGAMRGVDPRDPYFMDLRFATMIQGFGQYFSWLYGTWGLPVVALLAAAAFARPRLGVFFLGYTFITFLPVIFLPNHRWPFFWYIPFFGIAGLFGMAAKEIQVRLRHALSIKNLASVNAALLVGWTLAHGGMEFYRSRATRAEEARLAGAFESFVEGIRQIGQPEAEAVLYFDRVPPNFTPQILESAVRVVLDRNDIHAEIVPAFPAAARWKLSFVDGGVQRMQ